MLSLQMQMQMQIPDSSQPASQPVGFIVNTQTQTDRDTGLDNDVAILETRR